MKISFVTTVFNEEKSIGLFLKSLAVQTKKPDEVIIVDGGSTDNTIIRIKNEKLKMKNENLKLKIFIKLGASIAQGRNFGIKKAKGEIIAMSDAGCVIHPGWLEKITQPFADEDSAPQSGCGFFLRGCATLPFGGAAAHPRRKTAGYSPCSRCNKNADLVAGFYRMIGRSVFQKCLACYLGVLPEKLDPKNFMPSTRSIAFRKKVWEKVGGFNEKLRKTGEDTFFNYQVKKLGINFLTVKDALVDWEVPPTWQEAINKFYSYAQGDAQAGIWWHPSQRLSTHNLKISAIYFRYLLGLVFLVLGFFSSFFWLLLGVAFLGYLFWAIHKSYKYVQNWQAIFVLPSLQIVSDLAVMAGFLKGGLTCPDED